MNITNQTKALLDDVAKIRAKLDALVAEYINKAPNDESDNPRYARVHVFGTAYSDSKGKMTKADLSISARAGDNGFIAISDGDTQFTMPFNEVFNTLELLCKQ